MNPVLSNSRLAEVHSWPPVTPGEPIRVMVVDDHPSLLWGLRKVIESASPSMCVVAQATCREEALRAARESTPDVILLDVDLQGDSGIDCIAEIRSFCAARVIIITGSSDTDVRRRAVISGASGFIHKSASGDTIIQAIAHVHAGRLWLDTADLEQMLHAGRAAGKSGQHERRCGDHLTPAEMRIVAAVIKHHSAPNKVIADSLNISAHTLRNHLASVYGKLGIRSRLDLVLYARDHRLELVHA